MKNLTILMFIIAAMGIAGCQWNRSASVEPDYQTVIGDPARNTQLAKKYNSTAVILLKEDNLEGAERQLKDALAADVFFGPAHNNLGNVYYRQKKYYLAAWEFQYAAKLMPNNAEPKNNLGMVLEIAGKPDEAAEHYEAALKLQPDNPVLIGNLAKLYTKEGKNNERTHELLNEIIMKDSRPKWKSWASQQLAKIHFNDSRTNDVK